mmetsp:Transcript_23867/g.21208  ORF Transcript_23867/g.21208 Transcript_23867/m.21208 type:complete len:143 (+) Transcript_23867:232-660(+)
MQIPDIQIKVGIQNNHYNYRINNLSLTDTISEIEEDDEKYAVIGIKNQKTRQNKFNSLEFKIKKPGSKDCRLSSPKANKPKTPKFLPNVGFSKRNNELYKRHNIEPPIDLRSTSRRYREMLQTRLNHKRRGYKDKSNLRSRK